MFQFLEHFPSRLMIAFGRAAPDLSPDVTSTMRRVAPFTMTSRERLAALVLSVEYIVDAGVPGAFVECGVWRGGSMMAAAETLTRLGEVRELYLYDTFEGMPAPGVRDISVLGESAKQVHSRMQRRGRKWDHASIDDVRSNLRTIDYPLSHLHFVQGRVEDTLPENAPAEIALLRLDTDWYESTLHELNHLYPRLSPGGILIVDDYGHWKGARQAVDEYFEKEPVFLHRIDYSGRLVLKR